MKTSTYNRVIIPYYYASLGVYNPACQEYTICEDGSQEEDKKFREGGEDLDDNLEQLAREERARYAREWRAKNRDRVRASNQRYWKKRAAKAAGISQEEKN